MITDGKQCGRTMKILFGNLFNKQSLEGCNRLTANSFLKTLHYDFLFCDVTYIHDIVK